MNVLFQGINSPPDPDMGPDHIEYDQMAQNFVAGKGFSLSSGPTTNRPPGVSFLLIPVYFLFGVNYAIVRIMFSLLGALTCIVIYFIGKKVHDEKLGIFAALLLSIYPMHFYYSQHLYSEVPWAFFMSLGVYYALRFQEKNRILDGVLMGSLICLSSYIRPVAIFYLPIYTLWGLSFAVVREPMRYLKWMLLPSVVFIVLILPWMIRNYRLTGHMSVVTTHGGAAIWGAHNEKVFEDLQKMGSWIPQSELPGFKEMRERIKNPAELDKLLFNRGISVIKNNLSKMPMLEIMKLYRMLTPFYHTPNKLFNLVGGIGWVLLFPLVLIGVGSTLKERLFVPLHATLLLILFITLVFYGDHRFTASISPFLVIYASIAFFKLVKILRLFDSGDAR